MDGVCGAATSFRSGFEVSSVPISEGLYEKAPADGRG